MNLRLAETKAPGRPCGGSPQGAINQTLRACLRHPVCMGAHQSTVCPPFVLGNRHEFASIAIRFVRQVREKCATQYRIDPVSLGQGPGSPRMYVGFRGWVGQPSICGPGGRYLGTNGPGLLQTGGLDQ